MTHPPEVYSLLALCATAQGKPTQYQALQQALATFNAWQTLALEAEKHGLTPLLYTHLQAVGLPLPQAVKGQLQTRTMQHAHANQVRAGVLGEVLTAFDQAGIDSLILKGMALAHQVYPQLGWRSMRDVDVLVSRSQVRQAQALLSELGFKAPLPGQNLPAKHLTVAQRREQGLLVSLEIHHNLYADGTSASELEALRPTAQVISIAGVRAYTLGHEAMLDHIYRHAANIFNPLRLIWVADLVSLAERFACDINWAQVDPQIRNALLMCHWLTPLHETLLQSASLRPGRPPKGIGQEFRGWPRFSLAVQRDKGYFGILGDAFFPSEWWLRFYYGLPAGPALWWGRAVRHPLHIGGWLGHYFLSRGNKLR